ncbi:substrate-binding domain-containing protein [Paenibacillus sp. FSL H8-0537]|uniref:substrate-binding domain-containing protein n=1 Tax=Paenibacillus sp. FSL H8-0537 TaxID=2921399 RepID=UPI003101A615
MSVNRRLGRLAMLCIAAIAAALLLGSCTMQRAEDSAIQRENIDISLLLKRLDGDYWNSVVMGAEAASKEFNVTLHISAPEKLGSPEQQLETAKLAMVHHPDAVVFAAGNDEVIAGIVQAGGTARLPLVAIDTETNTGGINSIITVDHHQAGRAAALKMVELLAGKGSVALLTDGSDDNNQKSREAGIREALAEESGMTVIGSEPCMERNKNCRSVVSSLLNKQQVDGILALNVQAAVAAALEIKKQGLGGGKVKIIAFDSSMELLELLQEDQLQVVLVQNPFSIGYLGIKNAVLALRGEEVPSHVAMETKLINGANLFWPENQRVLFPFIQK